MISLIELGISKTGCGATLAEGLLTDSLTLFEGLLLVELLIDPLVETDPLLDVVSPQLAMANTLAKSNI